MTATDGPYGDNPFAPWHSALHPTPFEPHRWGLVPHTPMGHTLIPPYSDIPAEALGDEEVSRLLAEREELMKQLETKRKSGAVQRAIEILTKQNEALRRELAGEPQPKGSL